MTAEGHGPALLSTAASGRCRFSQATFAGAHGNGRDAPKFPAPIQLSDHKIAWLEAEIDAMIAARAEERNKKPINSRPPESKRLPGRPRKISPPAEVASCLAAPLAAAAAE
jgi:predicted DNA-binding transcriptional regulator AlpA